jgi:hypothetical protein
MVQPSWTNTEVLTKGLVKTPWTNTDVLTTELVKSTGTNTEVLTTGLVTTRVQTRGSDYRGLSWYIPHGQISMF